MVVQSSGHVPDSIQSLYSLLHRRHTWANAAREKDNSIFKRGQQAFLDTIHSRHCLSFHRNVHATARTCRVYKHIPAEHCDHSSAHLHHDLRLELYQRLDCLQLRHTANESY